MLSTKEAVVGEHHRKSESLRLDLMNSYVLLVVEKLTLEDLLYSLLRWIVL